MKKILTESKYLLTNTAKNETLLAQIYDLAAKFLEEKIKSREIEGYGISYVTDKKTTDQLDESAFPIVTLQIQHSSEEKSYESRILNLGFSSVTNFNE